jgi:hypothetical protein
MIAQAGSTYACFVDEETAKELRLPGARTPDRKIYFGWGVCAALAAGDISANWLMSFCSWSEKLLRNRSDWMTCWRSAGAGSAHLVPGDVHPF